VIAIDLNLRMTDAQLRDWRDHLRENHDALPERAVIDRKRLAEDIAKVEAEMQFRDMEL
jgi:hypothetical protein